MTNAAYIPMANAIRALAMDAVERASSGHPGLPMGMADVATVLCRDFLHVDPSCPDWPDRDRLVLSAGHGSMLLYALAYLLGYKKVTLEALQNFRQLGSITAGHPEHDVDMLVETTTGPLGQGFANAVGMALAERCLNANFGDALVNHHTYVIASDGDMQEGINHEAAALAGHLRLQKLIVLYDDNKISIDGPTALSMSEDVTARYAAYGWATRALDGHDHAAIHAALTWAQQQSQPVLLLCRTTIGFGAPTKAGTKDCHGSPLGAAEVAGARAQLNWPHEPFVIPADTLTAWRATTKRAAQKRAAWEAALAAADSSTKGRWQQYHANALPAAASAALTQLKQKFLADKPSQATRVASGQVLAALAPHLPNLIGGSADLTPSNNTFVKGSGVITAPAYQGNYIHWGVREFGMAAALNGMALHGGITPYGGTFLVFSDYCRPALRLAALMRQRVIFVFTHDSIGLGEDGPTHQPVEHLAALRAIPHLQVLRPADAIETLEAWELALQHNGPTVLCLTRQNVPALRLQPSDDNKLAHGGYVLHEEAGATITLIASGSEVALAQQVAAALHQQGKHARVVSMPCPELFFRQPSSYQDRVLQSGTTLPVVIEAGVRQGWERIVGAVLAPTGLFFGVDDFGASAPYQKIYEKFGLTRDNITKTIMAAV